MCVGEYPHQRLKAGRKDIGASVSYGIVCRVLVYSMYKTIEFGEHILKINISFACNDFLS